MTQTAGRWPIGRILREGGLLSEAQLDEALREQGRTRELLGQLLVRTAMIDSGELAAALSEQEHLNDVDQAIRFGTGMRQFLGALLVHCGKLTVEQLELALAEQRQRGGRLGEVCVELGFFSEAELANLLAFQRQHGGSRHVGHPGLGEVLGAILSLATLLLPGCGGGGEHSAPTAVNTSVGGGSSTASAPARNAADYFAMTIDEYGIIKPNFYYSTNNDLFWSIQANVATSVTDPNTVTVYRIDIAKGGAFPALNQAFSIEAGTALPQFPGQFLVFDGAKSVTKKVEQGTITFTPGSSADSMVSGSFDVVLTDYDSATVPSPRYRLQGAFSFVIGTYNTASGV